MQHQLQLVGTQITVESVRDIIQSDVPTEIVAHQLVASTLALVQWWLDNEQPYSPARMGEIYETLVLCPLRLVSSPGSDEDKA